MNPPLFQLNEVMPWLHHEYWKLSHAKFKFQKGDFMKEIFTLSGKQKRELESSLSLLSK
jgi:hypothetical protein